jgi:protein-tyrosine-phosphatase
MRIVFVCLGNICRSPAAEGVMRKLAPHLTLDSAGTGAGMWAMPLMARCKRPRVRAASTSAG